MHRFARRRVAQLAYARQRTFGQRACLHIAKIRQLGSALSVSSLEQGFDRVCNPEAETLGRDGRVRIWSGRAPRELGLRADAGADGVLNPAPPVPRRRSSSTRSRAAEPCRRPHHNRCPAMLETKRSRAASSSTSRTCVPGLREVVVIGPRCVGRAHHLTVGRPQTGLVGP